jgi:hypothetical protein
MKQNIVIGIVAALVIIGGIIWYMNQNKAAAPTVNDNTNAISEEEEKMVEEDADYVGDVPGDAPTNTNVPTSATVAVSTQLPGNSVTIDNVFLDKAGFVAIREVDAKGQPTAIIGSSALLGTGARQDLEITAPIKAGGKYIAMLYTDNGDKKFNSTSDTVVLNKNVPIMMMFSVSQ